jgi:hypothetical protein
MMKYETLNYAEVIEKYKHKRLLLGINKIQENSLKEWQDRLEHKEPTEVDNPV